MKKILVVFFAIGLLFTLGTCASANSVYLGTLVNGAYHEEGNSDNDAAGTILGGSFLLAEKFTIKFDYLTGQDEVNNDDYLNWNLMFGYRAVSNDQLDLDVSLGYGVNNFYDNAYEATAILLGLDLTFRVSDNFLISAEYYQSLSGDLNTADDYAITGYKLNFEYLFNESYSIGLGYRDFTSSANGPNDYGVSGLTLSVGFYF
jgi:hypothetical protein